MQSEKTGQPEVSSNSRIGPLIEFALAQLRKYCCPEEDVFYLPLSGEEEFLQGKKLAEYELGRIRAALGEDWRVDQRYDWNTGWYLKFGRNNRDSKLVWVTFATVLQITITYLNW